MFSKLSLTNKLLLITSAVVVLSVGVGTMVMTRWSGDQARAAVMNEGRQLGYRHAADIERQLQDVMLVADQVRGAILSAIRSGAATRGHVNQLLKDTLVEHQEYLGVWAGFEPQALGSDAEHVGSEGSDQTGRLLSYWNRGGGDIVLEALTDYDKEGAGDYYLIPKKTRAQAIIEPYMYKVAGKDVLITSLAVPIVKDGVFLGVAGIDIALDKMSERIQAIRPFGNGDAAVISNAGHWVAFRKADFLGKPIDEADASLAEVKKAVRDGTFFSAEVHSRVLDAQILRLAFPVNVGQTKTPWSLLIGLPLTKAEENAAEVRNRLLGGSAVFLTVLMGTLGVVLLVMVRRPLGRTITVIESMATGNYDVSIPDQARGDEIGRINHTLQLFKENAGKVAELQHQQQEAAEHAAAERRRMMLAMADRFEASVLNVVETVASAATEMQRAAGTLTATAEQTSQQAQAVAVGSNQASSNVQTVAAATEELSASITEVTKQMSQSTAIAERAVSDAGRTDTTILSLAEAVGRISSVADLINSIAGQTNLLALNATIEAARAGEAGKGFAVVASEVKSLANQTAKATEEISAEIARVQSVTDEAVQAIKVIGGTIGEMSEITGSVAAAAEEQAAATSEITRNLQEAARGTQDVSSHITGVSQGAGETGAAASQVLGAADELGMHAETLRAEVNRFLAQIRAA